MLLVKRSVTVTYCTLTSCQRLSLETFCVREWITGRATGSIDSALTTCRLCSSALQQRVIDSDWPQQRVDITSNINQRGKLKVKPRRAKIKILNYETKSLFSYFVVCLVHYHPSVHLNRDLRSEKQLIDPKILPSSAPPLRSLEGFMQVGNLAQKLKLCFSSFPLYFPAAVFCWGVI